MLLSSIAAFFMLYIYAFLLVLGLSRGRDTRCSFPLPDSLPPSPLSKALFYSSSTRLLLPLFYPMLSPFLLDLYLNVLPMLSFPLLND